MTDSDLERLASETAQKCFEPDIVLRAEAMPHSPKDYCGPVLIEGAKPALCYNAEQLILSALRKVQPAWIPVSESLPECRRAVLAFCPEFENTYTAYLDDDGYWNYFAGGGVPARVRHDVAFWMPLPPGPVQDRVGEKT